MKNAKLHIQLWLQNWWKGFLFINNSISAFVIRICKPSTTTQLMNLFFFNFMWWGVHLVHWPLIGLLYQPWMLDEYGAFGGMWIGRGKRSTQREPAPLPHCPPQIPHDLTWDQTWAATVGNRRLTPDLRHSKPVNFLIHIHALSTQQVQLLIIYSKLATCSSLVGLHASVHLFRWNCCYCLCSKYWPVCKCFSWCCI
jgi:hypothetical protein